VEIVVEPEVPVTVNVLVPFGVPVLPRFGVPLDVHPVITVARARIARHEPNAKRYFGAYCR